jgi:cytochrome c553
MVRDEQGAWDGWFWSDGSPTISYANYPNAGFGLYCVNCHASAKTDVTFASMNNIIGNPLVFNTTMGQPNLTPPLAATSVAAANVAPSQRLTPEEDTAVHLKRDAKPDVPPALRSPASTGLRGAGRRRAAALASAVPKQMVSEWYDTATQTPPDKPRQMFLTSNQCIGCHDATQSNASMPNMIYQPPAAPTPTPGPPALNLSPYGEWRASMMGLSGRDPVFFAQLETEMNLHPEIADQTVDTCLSCHGVMGQRQIHLDKKGLMRLGYLDTLTNQTPAQPFAEYGALARDGVS